MITYADSADCEVPGFLPATAYAISRPRDLLTLVYGAVWNLISLTKIMLYRFSFQMVPLEVVREYLHSTCRSSATVPVTGTCRALFFLMRS